MPFAFSTIDDRTSGQVSKLDIGTPEYLSAAWDEGMNNSMFASVYNYNELGTVKDDSSMFGMLKWDNGKKLDPNTATQRYGMPGLSFTEPVTEGAAQMMRDRHVAETYRQFTLSQGSKSLLSLRGAAGMATQMIASTMNPLDLGTMFLPWTGSEKAAAMVGKMGVATKMAGEGFPTVVRPGIVDNVRAGIAHGLIANESLSALPTPKLIESVIHGVGFQGLAEIPNVLSKIQEGDEHPLSDLPRDLITQAGFAAALHGAGRLMNILEGGTKEYMFRKAIDDFVKGDDVNVGKVATLDPNAIHQQKIEEQLRNAMVDRNQEERVLFPAVQGPLDGTSRDIWVGNSHPQIWDQIGNPGSTVDWNEGFVSNHGNFLSRDEAWQMSDVSDSIDMRMNPDQLARDSADRQEFIRRYSEQQLAEQGNVHRLKNTNDIHGLNTPDVNKDTLRDKGNDSGVDELTKQNGELRQELGDRADKVERPQKLAKDPHDVAINCLLNL